MRSRVASWTVEAEVPAKSRVNHFDHIHGLKVFSIPKHVLRCASTSV